MHTIGIVAEYNPFHTGHAYHIARSRIQLDQNAPVIAVMSGNWVQRGEPAQADKWQRTHLALMGGADLVLELPTVWAMSSAESFARGAVSILFSTGCVENLSFGCEEGDAPVLGRLAACLDSPAYQETLRPLLNEGLPFAACRQRAVETLLSPADAALLSRPNANLGVEYLRSLNALDSSITPMTVERVGAGHDSRSSLDAPPPFLSASQLRSLMGEGRWDEAAPFLLPGTPALLRGTLRPGSGSLGLSQGILARLRTMTAEDWAALPDSGASEGLPLRLERAGKQCRSVEEFFELTKTKRYTRARLARLLCWAYLGLRAADIPSAPPYLRVLGFTPRGQELLKVMKTTARLPVLTKPAHARRLDGPGRALFELESRCTDLYDLAFSPVPLPGREWRTDPVRLGGEGL